MNPVRLKLVHVNIASVTWFLSNNSDMWFCTQTFLVISIENFDCLYSNFGGNQDFQDYIFRIHWLESSKNAFICNINILLHCVSLFDHFIMPLLNKSQYRYLGCFHTWPIVSDPGTFPPLAWFVWANVNTAIALGSTPKQSVRDLGSIANELWSGLVVVRKQSESWKMNRGTLTNERTLYLHVTCINKFGPFWNFAMWKQTTPRITSNIVIIWIPVSGQSNLLQMCTAFS